MRLPPGGDCLIDDLVKEHTPVAGARHAPLPIFLILVLDL
jgi:hypothetical protein